MKINKVINIYITYTLKTRAKVINKIKALEQQGYELCDYSNAEDIPSDEDVIRFTTLTLMK